MIELPLRAFEAGVNRCLALDPEGLQAWQSLDGYRVMVDMDGVGYGFCIHFVAEGVCLEGVNRNAPDTPPPTGDVTVKGPPFSLAGVFLRSIQGQPRVDADVQVAGDLGVLQRLQGVLGQVHIDWEELISAHTGDVAAHEICRGLQGLWGWGRGLHRNMEKNASEFVREELALLPGEPEVGVFNRAVDRLREDTDRLAARVERLLSRSGEPGR